MLLLSNYLVAKEFYDTIDKLKKVIILSTVSQQIRIINQSLWHEMSSGNLESLTEYEINDLVEAKFLKSVSEDEREYVLKDNQHYRESSKTYYCVIQPSASCQFGCHYCGQLHSPDKLNVDHQKLLIARVIKKLESGHFEKLTTSWFGGEPLTGLSAIYNISKELIDYCSKHGIIYNSKMVTNGLLLKRELALNLFENYFVDQFEITLDGDKPFHDLRRGTKLGQGTFSSIYKNVFDICSNKPSSLKITIRCNVDDRNKDGILPLLEKLKNDGLHEKLTVYFAPIHSWGNDAHKFAAERDNFASMEIEWLTTMISMGFQVDLLPNRVKELCMAVNKNSELLDPLGNIFSCTEVSLVPTYEKNGKNLFSLGKIDGDIDESKRKLLSDFYDEGVFDNFPCSRCHVFPVCGGGCPKQWKEGTMACPSFKINLPDRLLIHYANKKLGLATN